MAAKNNVDESVKDALLKRALGYEYEEKEIIASRDGKPEKIKIIKKHCPPDINAINKIMWLIKAGRW